MNTYNCTCMILNNQGGVCACLIMKLLALLGQYLELRYLDKRNKLMNQFHDERQKVSAFFPQRLFGSVKQSPLYHNTSILLYYKVGTPLPPMCLFHSVKKSLFYPRCMWVCLGHWPCCNWMSGHAGYSHCPSVRGFLRRLFFIGLESSSRKMFTIWWSARQYRQC